MKLSHFFTVIALTATATTLHAQTPINTVPEGIATFNLPATGVEATSTSYFSAPLVNDPVYTGALSIAPSATVITVGDTPPPWTTNQLTATGAPYFVKFLSGLQAGRILQVTGNSTNTLTLDTSDNSGQTVALNAANYSVAMGDTFEVFAGDTLALMFGVNTAQSPLLLKGGNAVSADSVSLYSASQNQLIQYYFSTSAGQWEAVGSTTNANGIVIRPYSGFIITRHGGVSGQAASSFVLTGRVAEVSHLVKTTGAGATTYDSTGYPVDVTLSNLKLVSNWQLGSSPITADTISIWNSSANLFDIYFEQADKTWRKVNGGTADQSSFSIPAATTVVFTRHQFNLSGSNTFVQPILPYSLTN